MITTSILNDTIRRSAILSDDGEYRYILERLGISDGRKILAVIGVNPSLADADKDDPTVRRIYGFCRTLGFSTALVGNKFARRSPDVKALRRPGDPIGPENDRYLAEIIRAADVVLVAWGPLAKLPEALRGRWKDVVRIADAEQRTLYCLGTAQDGHPRHPLMLPANAQLEEWMVPWFVGRSRQ